MTILFSFCLPVFNEENNIIDCLNTLFNQNFPSDKYEVVVADDASTDNTLKLLESYSMPLKLIKGEKNLGITGNRNRASQNTIGKILVHIDADCRYPPNFLHRLYDDFKLFSNLYVAVGSVCMPRFDENPSTADWLLMIGLIPHWSWIGATGNGFAVYKKIFDSMEGFKDKEIKGREDLYLWERLEKKYGRMRLLIDPALISYISLRRIHKNKPYDLRKWAQNYIKVAIASQNKKGYDHIY